MNLDTKMLALSVTNISVTLTFKYTEGSNILQTTYLLVMRQISFNNKKTHFISQSVVQTLC